MAACDSFRKLPKQHCAIIHHTSSYFIISKEHRSKITLPCWNHIPNFKYFQIKWNQHFMKQNIITRKKKTHSTSNEHWLLSCNFCASSQSDSKPRRYTSQTVNQWWVRDWQKIKTRCETVKQPNLWKPSSVLHTNVTKASVSQEDLLQTSVFFFHQSLWPVGSKHTNNQKYNINMQWTKLIFSIDQATVIELFHLLLAMWDTN